MASLAVLAALLVAFLVRPASSAWLGAYHVVADALLFLFFYGVLSALLLRVLLRMRPLRPGVYSMDDAHFTYWKFFTVIHEFGRGALLPFTTVFARPVVAALFGAKVGRNTAIGGQLIDPPFITIGDHAVLGLRSALVIGEGSVVVASSVVTMGTKIPPFELWGGAPARKIKDLEPADIRG
jgi:hypothetical protein